MQTYEAQVETADHVAARGYRNGWTLEQFVCRQIAKLQEELAEAEHLTIVSGGWLLSQAMMRAGETARLTFDNKNAWQGEIVIVDPEALRDELADVQVVLLNLASAVEELTGRHYDVVHEAVRKSKVDVTRGVR